MKATKLLGKLVVFVVAFLMVMLPVSTAAQLSQLDDAATLPGKSYAVPEELPYSYVTDSSVDPQFVICWPFGHACNDKCWTKCSSDRTFYCSSSGAVCCQSSAKFCDSSAGKCWTPCPSGQTWNCGPSGAYCTISCVDKDSDGYGSGCSKGSDCNDNNANINPGKSETCNGVDDDCDGQIDEGVKNACGGCGAVPSETCGDGKDNDCDGQTDEGCCAGNRDCGGQCWAACHSGETWKCGSWGGAYCCGPSDQFCGKSCWKPCPSGQTWSCGSDGKGHCTASCTDKDGDGYGSGCSKGSDCNDNDANVNPGKSEVCGDGKDNDCDGLVDEGCCPSSKPYFWNGQCRECPQDSPNKCSSGCFSNCNSLAYPHFSCDKYGEGTCCPKDWPYYCSRTGGCWQSSAQCSSAQKCGSEQYSNCLDPKNPNWNCRPNGRSVCCQTGSPYWWESDKQCHSSKEQEKCAVPDGSSAACTCNSNSDCPSSKPYCENNYPSPTSDGYDACLSTKPEYCGNGNCGSGENYNSCAADCGQFAPKGTISVDVYYSSGTNANKPISGAYVSLDGGSKGTTDSSGRKGFTASFGSRNVKVECPDSSYCDSKTVQVDGTEYVTFGCGCKSPVSFSNLRARFKAKTNAFPKGYPVANVDVLIDDTFKGASNQFGAVDIEGLTTGNHRIDVYLMVLEDGQEKRYIGGTSLTLASSYEEKNYALVKGSSPSAAYTALENGNEAFSLSETNVTPELVWIPIIVAVVWVAGTAWDAYDYEKCVERHANAWDPNKEDWSKFKCNTEMDEEQLNDCVSKLLSKNQNTIEGCGFEAGMLALNALPQESIPKTGLKLAVKLGKAVRIIPFIDDAAKGAYRTYRFVRGTESFVTVTDKLNKGAKYAFKLADNSLKIFDNSVGFIVNKIARNPDAWKKISEKVDNLLLNAKPSDIPAPKLGSVGNIQGVLGEKAKDEYVAVVKVALEKEGTSVAIEKGAAKATISRFANSQKYIVEYGDTGTGIEIFERTAKGTRGSPVGQIDGLIFVNDKPVIIEAKAARAVNIAGENNVNLDPVGFFNKKVKPIEDLTGQTPEVLLLIPKGETAKSTGFLKPTLSGRIDELSKHLENKGSHLAYGEFHFGVDDFEKSARSISKKAMSAINHEVGKYINSRDYGYAIHGVERFLNNDFDLLALPEIFSAEKKAQFVVALGKNDESFKISKKALSKIEFIKPTMKQTLSHFDEGDGVIRIIDNSNPDNLINVVLPHELAHAKIFDEFGALTSKVAGVPEGNVYDVLEDFFEISANTKALKHTANKAAFVEGIKKTPLLASDLTSSNVQDLLKAGDFGQVASVRSLAKKLGLQDKVDLIDDALSKTKYGDAVKGDAKKLFDLYDEYADFEGITSEAILKGRLSELYHKTLDLAKKGAIQ